MKIHQPQYIVNEQGKKTAVILDLKIFNKLLEELEDLYDIVEKDIYDHVCNVFGLVATIFLR